MSLLLFCYGFVSRKSLLSNLYKYNIIT
uniref:Uncharacterized protein n=1 Tax=Arundo donax TaxID=35708 RepID=A0A0A9C580_ARUDO